ncbi:helicase C-terminal domain-containing protein [uncultured Brevibacterium sp.]|uniref:helicase C-terminal domain-containing protein n=1 Tax=uncultured Brevibacterium sp. TaxID=189678 RepID=UPI0025CECC7F|nr:helicase C-terminal domain-containing protein [uncultured Brevibacterium sp.]
MTELDAEGVLQGLKPFQRDSVEHVFTQFYGDETAGRSRRFLVADETGLGKSIVARGLIAKVIDHLSKPDSGTDRIDIVYICSNLDLASQNLARLNVTGDSHVTMTSRLSMLAKENHRLSEPPADGGTKVNLVSFTPGTSFREGGWRQGAGPERALLVFLLDLITGDKDRKKKRATRHLLRGTVTSVNRFISSYVNPLRSEIEDTYDTQVKDEFEKIIVEGGLLAQFERLRSDPLVTKRSRWTDEYWHEVQDLISDLRSALSRAGVEALEPDLIILDEFQRFKHLLDPKNGDAAELAHSLFEYCDARVLLLSATPYKPFTEYGESEDDHARDFLDTVRFLLTSPRGTSESTESEGEDVTEPLQSALRRYRDSLITQHEPDTCAQEIRTILLPVMSRAERPLLTGREDLVQASDLGSATPTAEDIADWVALSSLGRTVGEEMRLDYWKSIPYFASFMDGYKIAHATDEQLSGSDPGPVVTALGRTRALDQHAVREFAPLDLGNGHLRAFADRTVGAGWWKLLWVPPTMPYLEPGEVYREFADGSMTKQVIFSAWTGVPISVASLLSYEADRRAAGDRSVLRSYTPEARSAAAGRLQYRISDDRAGDMSTLALFWPHPGVAFRADELASVRINEGRIGASEFAESFGGLRDERGLQPWEQLFSIAGSIPVDDSEDAESVLARGRDTLLDLLSTDTDHPLSGETSDTYRSQVGFIKHMELALDLFNRAEDSPKEVTAQVAEIAAFSPGCISLRAIEALTAEHRVSAVGKWISAMVLAEGLRSLFNRPETTALLSTLYGDDQPYWKRVLRYCADGNLRAVLDEYFHQLHPEISQQPITDDVLIDLVRTATSALTIRSARYLAHAADRDRTSIPFTARFAVRYGTRADTDDGAAGARMSEVRTAFMSPFAPFILASTSVGQEGIDFHWWSHTVLHWNTPSNPVDFEQREGRINRFGGHAVRKNIAQRHWSDVLRSQHPRAWHAAMSAAEATSTGLGDFSPWWMYPGDARIQRIIAQYPLSTDVHRYERLRSALTLYRLTLGQPRQEDFIELMDQQGLETHDLHMIDLRAPKFNPSR